VFAAPGVLGLALGGLLAATGNGAWWAFLPPLALVGWGVAGLAERPRTEDRRPKTEDAPAAHGLRSVVHSPHEAHHFDTHDLIMLVLLATIALRSAVWSTLDFLAQGRYETLLALALAAALGKLLGGPLADRIGWRRYAVGALALAAPLLALAGENLMLVLPGVALLQSATPAALAALSRQLPRSPATAAGLGLGLAIAIGGLPVAFGLGPALAAAPLVAALCLAAAMAMWLALQTSRFAEQRP
jgi:hypothetical protein